MHGQEKKDIYGNYQQGLFPNPFLDLQSIAEPMIKSKFFSAV
jgi:hypothetical protein